MGLYRDPTKTGKQGPGTLQKPDNGNHSGTLAGPCKNQKIGTRDSRKTGKRRPLWDSQKTCKTEPETLKRLKKSGNQYPSETLTEVVGDY